MKARKLEYFKAAALEAFSLDGQYFGIGIDLSYGDQENGNRELTSAEKSVINECIDKIREAVERETIKQDPKEIVARAELRRKYWPVLSSRFTSKRSRTAIARGRAVRRSPGLK
jgi:hypothetical protein